MRRLSGGDVDKPNTQLRPSADLYHRFLCHCFRSESAAARELIHTPGWSWERVFQRATEEAVLPALAATVNDGLDISAPRDVSDFLTALLSLSRDRNQRIWQELKTTVQLLNVIGIEPVLLKGAAYLAAGVYPDLGARYLFDIDLLIAEEHAGTAFRHLVEHDYFFDKTDHFGQFRHHYPPLRRGSVPIELHHKLGLGPCLSILPARSVIENATPIELEGLRVHIPSPTHLVMHLVMHSQIQHSYHERLWPPLRALLDLFRLGCHFGSSIDWAEVEYRFRSGGQGSLLRLHLLDLGEALGAEPPFECALTPMTHFRRQRRNVLRQFPALRYLDPIYMFSTICMRRLRIVRRVLAARDGFKFLTAQLLISGVYQRFILDVLEGRGR
jgi:Uncharacterised nucleotidyltransferase